MQRGWRINGARGSAVWWGDLPGRRTRGNTEPAAGGSQVLRRPRGRKRPLGHQTADPMAVGTPVRRKEGREKLTGEARYVDDMVLPGMLYGVTVRSPLPRARLKGIHFEGDLPWEEFTVITAADIPGRNVITLIEDDQPCLAEDEVRHREEPVALLAHPDPYLVQEARRHVRLDLEPLPAVLDMGAAQRDHKRILIEKGEVEAAWEQAHLVVEGQYRTGAQEQLYIEPQGMIATADPEGGITVWGSLQCPYYVHRALTAVFEPLPPEKIRVIQLETGGAFGGKEEYPSAVAAHAALLAWKSGRPVKLVYDRQEDMAATTKRHPSRTRHRTAVTRDGKLLAMEIDFLLDGGAYATLSPVVLSRGAIHAAGPYACPHVRIRARAVATNYPPYGAFRGFGNPQSLYALERHMDRVARALGLSPDEFRRRNLLREGQTTATGQVKNDGTDLVALLERALEESEYHTRRERFRRENPTRPVKRGMGIATFLHGSGFTGGGEKYLSSVAGIEGTPQGTVRVLAASVEMGQGTNTIFAQVVADALEIPYEMVEIARPDTARVPDSGPTVASRTCMIVGKLLENAALSLKQALVQKGLLEEPYTAEAFATAVREYVARHGELRLYSQYRQPATIQWSDDTYQGDAYAAYAWAAYVAQVAVDTRTWEARVEDFVAVQEIGRVVHPVLAAGQVEGGVAQGIGYALYEEVMWHEGGMLNGQMANYILPTAADVPPIRVFFHEVPNPFGPQGAKGVGELPIDGPAPAVVNAMEEALGVPLNDIPVTPERIMEACQRG